LKIAALSDIHGNNVAFDAVIADIQRIKADHILILGDMISDFYQSTRYILKTAKMLTPNVICGNREGYMIRNSDGDFGDSWSRYEQFSTNLKTWQQLDTGDLDYLRSLQSQISLKFNSFAVRAVHGSPFSEFDNIREGEEELMQRCADAIDEDILLCGHTHRPMIKQIGMKMIINVGSVGINFDKDHCAQYTVIEENSGEIKIDMRKVPYDYDAFKRTCISTDIWTHLCLKSNEDGINYNVQFLDEAQRRFAQRPVSNENWQLLADEWRKRYR